MGRSSVTGRLGVWPTEPSHTHEPPFPSGLFGPGSGLSLLSLPDGQFGEQHEQAFAEGAPPVTTDPCDMQLIGQANRPKIVSSTWRVRNIGYRRQDRPEGHRQSFPFVSDPVPIIGRADTKLQ